MNKIWQSAFLISSICVALAGILFVMFFGVEEEKTRKIGIIMTGSKEEEGWNGENYKGISSVCEKLGIELLAEENIKENSNTCADAVKRLASDGAEMIVLSSYGYSSEVADIIDSYPEITFYANSAEYYTENLNSFFGRMYQVRYLSGIVAGMQTETNKIGYVAAMPNSEVNRGINAFTLGVRRVNPEAEVIVHWVGSFDDREGSVMAADTLISEENVDIITYHQNRGYVAEAAERAGIYSIGYNNVPENSNENLLAAAVWNWDIIYEDIVTDYFQDYTNDKKHYWCGIESGVVELLHLSPILSDEIKSELEKAKEEIIRGKDVFIGEIYDNNGVLRCEKDEIISDTAIITDFDWYVDGVKMYGK